MKKHQDAMDHLDVYNREEDKNSEKAQEAAQKGYELEKDVLELIINEDTDDLTKYVVAQTVGFLGGNCGKYDEAIGHVKKAIGKIEDEELADDLNTFIGDIHQKKIDDSEGGIEDVSESDNEENSDDDEE